MMEEIRDIGIGIRVGNDINHQSICFALRLYEDDCILEKVAT